VQGFGKIVHLINIATCNAGKAVQKPMGEPAEHEGHEQDDGGRDDEFCAVHRGTFI
jgi:hypothetical protein